MDDALVAPKSFTVPKTLENTGEGVHNPADLENSATLQQLPSLHEDETPTVDEVSMISVCNWEFFKNDYNF